MTFVRAGSCGIVAMLELLVYLSMTFTVTFANEVLWKNWWSYAENTLNGPSFWGKVNSDWKLCKIGQQQSPIDIEPSRLLFDPNLKHLKIDSTVVNGLLINTGNDITLEIKGEGYNHVNISVGPLSYRYRVSQIKFHLASHDHMGSEHKVSGKAFPVEMQLMAYNSDLYKNITEATRAVKGLAVIAVFMEIGKENKEFYHISKDFRFVEQKDTMINVKHVSIGDFLPDTKEYMTYEGSHTQPGCHETVTWIVYNKPMWISREQLSDLRTFFRVEENNPKRSVILNSRPTQSLNHRVVRTNINTYKRSRLCNMEKETYYTVNQRYAN